MAEVVRQTEVKDQYDLRPDPHLDLIVGGQFKKILNLGAGAILFKSDLDGLEIHNHNQYHTEDAAKADWIFDLTYPWPIGNNVYDGITAFHCLEHIAIRQIMHVLLEAKRVLRPGGFFIIEVPWMKAMVEELVTDMPNYGILKAMFGDDRYPGEQHRWGYYGPDLVALLHAAGFARCVTKRGGSYANQQACLRVEAVHSGDENWTTQLQTKLNTPVYPVESQPYDFGSTNSTAPGAALTMAP